MSLALLRELIEQHDPRADVFADPLWELHELPTGHWAMFSLPCPLADLLDRIAAPPGVDSRRSTNASLRVCPVLARSTWSTCHP